MTDLTRVSSLMVNHTASGTGAVARRLSAVLGDVINVKDYGAVGDGSTNDSTAFAAAVAALPAGGGSIFIPNGVYALGSQFVIGLSSRRDVHLIGCGVGVTVLKWTAAGGGIRFHGGEHAVDWSALQISDMSLLTSYAAGGSAIDARWTNVAGSVAPSATVTNVEITGYGSGYWATGVYLYDAKQARVENVQMLGDPSDRSHFATGVLLASSDSDSGGADYGYASDIVIDKCSVYWADTAVKVYQASGVAGSSLEGLLISSCHFAAVNVGVASDTVASEPLISVVNSHVAAYSFGIDLEHHNSQITGNSFYGITTSPNACTLVNLRGVSSNVVVSGNTFYGAGSAGTGSGGYTVNGVVCADGTTDCVIANNSFWRVHTGVWFQNGSLRCQSSSNVFRDVGNMEVLNDSPANNGTNRNTNVGRLRANLVTRTTNQTVADNTVVAVSFDTENYDTGGITNLVSQSTRLTVPQGCTMVQITAQIALTGLSTTRAVTALLYKNGSVSFAGNPILSIPTDSGTQQTGGWVLNIASPPLNVAPGDYFEVCVSHLSDGSSLSIVGTADGRATWASLEVLE
jgi:hypothetical protein